MGERCTCPVEQDPYLEGRSQVSEACPLHGGSRGAKLPLIRKRARIVTRVTFTTPWPDGAENMADARRIVNARIRSTLSNAAWNAHGVSPEITEVQ